MTSLYKVTELSNVALIWANSGTNSALQWHYNQTQVRFCHSFRQSLLHEIYMPLFEKKLELETDEQLLL